MKAWVQRVKEASVTIDGETVTGTACGSGFRYEKAVSGESKTLRTVTVSVGEDVYTRIMNFGRFYERGQTPKV